MTANVGRANFLSISIPSNREDNQQMPSGNQTWQWETPHRHSCSRLRQDVPILLGFSTQCKFVDRRGSPASAQGM